MAARPLPAPPPAVARRRGRRRLPRGAFRRRQRYDPRGLAPRALTAPIPACPASSGRPRRGPCPAS
eukprot:scaffold24631_cov60-Phaeocystis_antarctica.AAC.3